MNLNFFVGDVGVEFEKSKNGRRYRDLISNLVGDIKPDGRKCET